MDATPERDALVQAARDLERLQRAFDAYQRRAFPARSPQFFALELAGEAGELANIQKKLWIGKPVDEAMVADEAADVLIAVMNFANSAGVDLAAAVARKVAVIDERRSGR